MVKQDFGGPTWTKKRDKLQLFLEYWVEYFLVDCSRIWFGSKSDCITWCHHAMMDHHIISWCNDACITWWNHDVNMDLTSWDDVNMDLTSWDDVIMQWWTITSSHDGCTPIQHHAMMDHHIITSWSHHPMCDSQSWCDDVGATSCNDVMGPTPIGWWMGAPINHEVANDCTFFSKKKVKLHLFSEKEAVTALFCPLRVVLHPKIGSDCTFLSLKVGHLPFRTS